MESTRKRRWWQFGLRWLFVVMLVVAAFFAGRSSVLEQSIRDRRELQQQNRRLAERVEDLLGYNLYSDELAENVKFRVNDPERTEKYYHDPDSLPSEREFVESMGIDLDRLPVRDEFGIEVYALSPHYSLIIQEGSFAHSITVRREHAGYFLDYSPPQ